jgi:polar amino acid transport system substrate-binding protein
VRLLSLLLAAMAVACDVPSDPRSTTEEIRNRAVLRVGATESPPFLMKTPGGATGVEAVLIEELARSHGARVDWHWGNVEDHYRSLETFDLDLVAGGIQKKTPWGNRVGLTRPYAKGKEGEKTIEYVMAVPPGENHWLTVVEKHLLANEHRVDPLTVEFSK